MNNENLYPIVKLLNNEVPSLSTINASKYESPFKAKIAEAKLLSAKDAVPVSSMINKTIELDEVAFVPTEVTGSDGVIYNSVRTIVQTKDGEIFATNSKVFAESVAMILNICGSPSEWDEPVHFVVKQIDLSNARRCFKLEIAD